VRTSTLEFRNVPARGIYAFVDGEQLVASGTTRALTIEDARVVVRLLQGWTPPERPPPESMQTPTSKKWPGWYGVRPVSGTVRLPGGDDPDVPDDQDAFAGRDGIPLSSCDCGSGVACQALCVRIRREHSIVIWDTDDGRTFRFDDRAYQAAMRRLLRLVGETPKLLGRRPTSGP
jgi:hypothetical protein